MAGFDGAEITPEHLQFHLAISDTAAAHTAQTVEQLTALFDMPPSDLVKRNLIFDATINHYFSSPDASDSSRFFPGDIAGSDAFAFRGVRVPQEYWDIAGYELVGRKFNSWIMSLTVRYGEPSETSDVNLEMVVGRGWIPLLIDGTVLERGASYRKLEYFWSTIEGIQPNKIHLPTAEELRLLREGFAAARQDIDLATYLRNELSFLREPEAEDPVSLGILSHALQKLEEGR